MKKIIIFLLAIIPFVTYAQQPPEPEDTKTRSGAVKLTDAEAKALAEKNAAETKAPVDLALVKVYTPEAGDPVIIDYTKPDTFYDEGLIGTIKAGLLALIAALGGFIPALRKLSASSKGMKLVTSGVVVLLALTSLVVFREGAFTENFFTMITKQFLPNFAYAGMVYSAYKLIIGLIPKKDKPATVPT
jgi:hypothetical protein